MMTPDQIRALRIKTETDRQALLAEIEQRARGESPSGEVTILRPLSRTDRLLLEAGLSPRDLIETEALVEEQRQRRDKAFEESRAVAPTPRNVVTVLPEFPFVRTWADEHEVERRLRGGK